MGKARRLKQQRREEERKRHMQRLTRRRKQLQWSVVSVAVAGLAAVVLTLVLVRLPSYVDQMVIRVTGRGTVVVELKEREAPQTTAHLKALVNNGSYRGATFYMVDENAVMAGIRERDLTALIDQGKLQEARDKDQGVEKVPDEVGLPNLRGSVAMAKPSDEDNNPLPDSASNEFYILRQDSPHLDEDYTVFGEVVKGMEVVDGLGKGEEILAFRLDESGRILTLSQPTGDIVIELKPEAAPLTVQHITDLVRSGFYEGMNWYRVEDWVVQTGSHARSLEQKAELEVDPLRYAEEIKQVPSEGRLPAVRGAVALFRLPEEASQQAMPQSEKGQTEFFITRKDLSEQVGTYYTVFGEVIEGMEVVDALQQGDKIESVYIQRVRKD